MEAWHCRVREAEGVVVVAVVVVTVCHDLGHFVYDLLVHTKRRRGECVVCVFVLCRILAEFL